VHAPVKTIAVQSHPIYHNSTGPFSGSSQYPTASGLTGLRLPASGSSRSTGIKVSPHASGTVHSVGSKATLGTGYSKPTIAASASVGRAESFRSSASGYSISGSAGSGGASSKVPFPSGETSSRSAFPSRSGVLKPVYLSFGTGDSQSASMSGTAYSNIYSSPLVAPHSNALDLALSHRLSLQ